MEAVLIYKIYHWWKGDDHSDPQWVHSGDYLLQEVDGRVKQLKSNGFSQVKVIEVKSKEIDNAGQNQCL